MIQLKQKQLNKKKPKKQVPKKLEAYIEIAKEIQASQKNKYPEIKYRNFVAIAGLVWKDAEKQAGTNADFETIKKTAKNLVKNPEKYIKKWQEEENKKEQKTSASRTNRKYNTLF